MIKIKVKMDKVKFNTYIDGIKSTKFTDFDDFYTQMCTDECTMSLFHGIDKSFFPKWRGWSIINEYKKNGIKVQDLNDSVLDVLVTNHYRMLFIKYCLGLEV